MESNDIVTQLINTLADRVVAQASSRIEAILANYHDNPVLIKRIELISRDMATQVLQDPEEIDPAITASASRLLEYCSEFSEQMTNLAHRTAEQVLEKEDLGSLIRKTVDDLDFSEDVQAALDDFDLSREIRETVETEVDDRMADHQRTVAQTVREVLSTATITLPAK